MRTLCMLGGMTPQVTSQVYYNLINETIRTKLGQRHSARMYIFSVDLETQLRRVQSGNWSAFAGEFIDAVLPLVQPKPVIHGVFLGAILAHKVSAQIRQCLPPEVEFLDISDFLATQIRQHGITTVALVGPGITMRDASSDFFIGKLSERYGIKVLVPDTEAELNVINRGMLEEVVKGPDAVTPQTKAMFLAAANRLIDRGAQGLILGSTDLGFVLNQTDFGDRAIVLDAAKVHAIGLAEWAIQDE